MEAKEKRGGYLIFESGGYALAVRLEQVERVLEKDALGFSGEGVDFGSILGLKDEGANYCLEVKIKGELRRVLVSKIEPIKDLQLAVWLDFPKIMRDARNGMIEGFFFDGGRMISLIDLERVGWESV